MPTLPLLPIQLKKPQATSPTYTSILRNKLVKENYILSNK